MDLAKKLLKFKDFIVKNEHKIVLVVGFCLASAISFGFGTIWGQKWQQKPLVIETPVNVPTGDQIAKIEPSGTPAADIVNPNQPASSVLAANATNMSSCAFVGSKNSDKFYVPSCSYAKRIKPENLACYKDEQEALAKGKVKSDCR